MASISEQASLRTISRSDSRSSHGQNSPLPRASTHRDSLSQEHDIPANGTETQPSLASFRAPSNSNSIREGKDTRFSSFRQAMHWKTIGSIIGFLFAALLSALGHYQLFINLDRTLTDTSYLSQPQVSAVSILLTTIFKAALTASVGICFAQHLWLVLRGNAIPLATIEKLFILRTNILALCDLRSTWRAPLLVFMALFLWCLGIATIYPPGALIVTFEAYTFTEKANLSVINPPIPPDLDFASNGSFPTLSRGDFGDHYKLEPDPNGNAIRERYIIYGGPTSALSTIAQSIITDNHAFNLPGHPGENSTYKLQFRGPQFRCKVSRYNSSIPLEMITSRNDTGPFVSDWVSAAVFVSEWLEETLLFSVKQHNVSRWSIVHDDQNKTSYKAHVETIEQSCTPKSVLYNVSVTSLRSVQSLEHHLSDEKEMLKKWNDSQTGMTLDLPAEPYAARDWNQRVLDTLPAFNEWALLDALGSSLEGVFLEQSPTYQFRWCKPRAGPENGTMIEDCNWDRTTPCAERRPLNSPKAPLIGTVFQPARFDSSREPSIYDCDDPREDLELTEALLNDVLTNITLSAISLGTWWAMVPVNVTRYQSTYSFANPLNLILPYSICLAAATIFAAIAIWSLSRNGTPAADGGFLQIMTATRGNTKMERLVLQEQLIIIENMSAELKSLEVRYGELVSQDVLEPEGRIIGFGTKEETVSLRKQK